MNQWQLQEAKAHLSQVVRSAVTDGPQEITLRGEAVVIVIAKKDYEKLLDDKPNLVEFLRNSPLAGAGVDLKLKRDKTPSRDIDL